MLGRYAMCEVRGAMCDVRCAMWMCDERMQLRMGLVRHGYTLRKYNDHLLSYYCCDV
ncbi:MAG: hypothetical protein BYD32DRAFT_421146 [Podila humilis]|nr:MAG: hypothetical protein BYD32DRAFT_421146 [Podila humilis]